MSPHDTLPPCVAALGFVDTPDIDERALRRAYARLLKQIDVEAEPARFQALREALDQSLRWLALRDRARAAPGQATAAEAPPSASPTPTMPASHRVVDELPPLALPPRLPTADGIGSAVYATFHQSVTQVFRNVAGAREALDTALADERLINIDARTVFEGHVAGLLANGWRPGHDHLLDPAIEVFGWERDHARLAHFGQAGALVDAAIRDRAVFRQFNGHQIAVLTQLILRLRDAAPPNPGTLHEEVQQLQYLVQRVPNWLRIVAPVDPVNARFEMWRQSPASTQSAMAAQPPRVIGAKPPSATMPALLVMAALLVLVVFAGMGNRGNGAHAPRVDPQGSQEADIDLALRQQRAEALLSNIQSARPTPTPWARAQVVHRPAAATTFPPAPATPPARSGADKPWWAPDWAAPSGSPLPDFTPPPSGAPAR
jgi:protein TonB